MKAKCACVHVQYRPDPLQYSTVIFSRSRPACAAIAAAARGRRCPASLLKAEPYGLCAANACVRSSAIKRIRTELRAPAHLARARGGELRREKGQKVTASPHRSHAAHASRTWQRVNSSRPTGKRCGHVAPDTYPPLPSEPACAPRVVLVDARLPCACDGGEWRENLHPPRFPRRARAQAPRRPRARLTAHQRC